MKKDDVLSYIDLGGDDSFGLKDERELKTSLEDLAQRFYLKVVAEAEKRKHFVSGDMISDKNLSQRITKEGSLTTVELFMVEYADYVNQGVKGVKSDKNAPNSPYQFKTLGMPEDARKGLKDGIAAGKIRLTDKSKTKYGKEGLETKSKDTANQDEINEREANTMAYLIKAYGIKTSGFIDTAWKEWAKEIKPDLAKAAKKQLISLIKIVNK
jgi:hypothetical protein